MARTQNNAGKVTRTQKAIPTARNARTLAAGRRGVRTGRDFATFMSNLMIDVIDGRVAPNVANAACSAGGKLLKMVEMEYKYARPKAQRGVPNSQHPPTLQLSE